MRRDEGNEEAQVKKNFRKEKECYKRKRRRKGQRKENRNHARKRGKGG